MNGLEIKDFRKKHSLSQDELANLVGVSVSAVRSWEQNKRNISTTAEKIIESFEGGISPVKLPGSKPFYNIPVSAGKSLFDIVGKKEPDGYICNLPGMSDTEAFLPVIGFSLYPEVKENAIIGVRSMNNWETLDTSKKYLIICKDERMIKYIEHDLDNDDILWCTSTNFPKFKIYKTDIIEIKRVTMVMNPE